MSKTNHSFEQATRHRRFVTEDEIFHFPQKNDGFLCFRKKRQPVKKCQIGASGLCALCCARVRPAAGADHFALVIFNRPGQGLVCTWEDIGSLASSS